MTDVSTETVGPDTEAEGWDQPSVTYPEYGPLPEARISLNFTPGKAPQLTVRAHTATELTAALQELEEGNVYNVIGLAHASMGAQVSIGAGLGPVTQIPQGAPAAPAAPGMPTPPPFGPNVSVPQAPGFQGNPGFTPPPQGGFGGGQASAPRDNTPEFQQNGWYALTVPFPVGKKQFDRICAQYQLKKGRPAEGGTFSFNGANKTWYVSPQVAGCFPMFSPMPA